MIIELFFWCAVLFYVKASDPCTDFKVIDKWERSVANDDTSSLLCDSFLPAGWYKSVSHAGNEMPTECPEGGYRCGTARSIWINGSNPSPGNIANVTACVSDYQDCCSKSYKIQIKNCNGYFVYNLIPTTACAEAYCFGKELPCPPRYNSTNGFTPGCKFDPCMPINYDEIDDWKRSSKNNNSGGWICDSFLNPGWYRPTSKAGNLMPTSCQPFAASCGTAKPIWMNGLYPQTNEIANVTACVSSSDNCCSQTYNIQVKNCSAYNVYNLVPTNRCPQAYCFGSEVPCPPGYTSNNNFTPGCELNPCDEINYKWLKDQIKRSSNYTLQETDEPFDDSKLAMGWYRVDSATGNDMVNTTQSLNNCGTIHPIWMKGYLPTVSDKTVNRRVCVTRDVNGNCMQEFEVQVRNCGTFRTYFLPQFNISKAGYCFGTLPVPGTNEKDTTDKSDKSLSFIIWVAPVAVGGIIIVIGLVVYVAKKKLLTSSSVSCAEKPSSPPPPYSPTDVHVDAFIFQPNTKPGFQTTLTGKGF